MGRERLPADVRGLMPISGRATDRLGRRRVLVWGIALFTGASPVCGLSSSQAMLVVASGARRVGSSGARSAIE